MASSGPYCSAIAFILGLTPISRRVFYADQFSPRVYIHHTDCITHIDHEAAIDPHKATAGGIRIPLNIYMSQAYHRAHAYLPSP